MIVIVARVLKTVDYILINHNHEIPCEGSLDIIEEMQFRSKTCCDNNGAHFAIDEIYLA